MSSEHAKDAPNLLVDFRIATPQDAPQLLELINAGYSVSEKFMWKDNAERTNITDVTTILEKGLSQQDMYIVAVSKETGEIIASVRYEPTISMVSCESSCSGDCALETSATDTVEVSKWIGNYPALSPSSEDLVTNQVTIPYSTLFKDDQFKMAVEKKIYNPSEIIEIADFAQMKALIPLGTHPVSINVEGYFSQFSTSLSHQGKGFGGMLLQFIEEFTVHLLYTTKQLLEAYAPALNITFSDNNTRAILKMIVLSPREDMIRFYVKRNFKHTKVFPPEPYMCNDVNEHYAESLCMLQFEKY